MDNASDNTSRGRSIFKGFGDNPQQVAGTALLCAQKPCLPMISTLQEHTTLFQSLVCYTPPGSKKSAQTV